MSRVPESHPPAELLADIQAGESPEGLDRALGLAHLQGCAECRAEVARLESGMALLRQAPVPAPSELEWARLAREARQRAARTPSRVAAIIRAPFSWRMVAAAALVAVMIPATLAWLLPPCRGSAASGDLLVADDPGL